MLLGGIFAFESPMPQSLANAATGVMPTMTIVKNQRCRHPSKLFAASRNFPGHGQGVSCSPTLRCEGVLFGRRVAYTGIDPSVTIHKSCCWGTSRTLPDRGSRRAHAAVRVRYQRTNVIPRYHAIHQD